MNTKDPIFTALQFNEYVNNQDIQDLSNLMTDDHTFIDRKGEADHGKETMIKEWIDFFKVYLEYWNRFLWIESQECRVVVLYGYATWEQNSDPNYTIWTAKIENDLVAEWRISEDTEDNKKRFNLV
jgi:hypothetical protein